MSNAAASVHACLLNVAKALVVDFNEALERIPEPLAAIVDRLRAILEPALNRAAQ